MPSGAAATKALGRSVILECSNEANKRDVFSGMRLAAARAICADLIWQEYDCRLYEHAHKKLINELIACSPRVSSYESGIFILDASGLRHLGGENKFCRNILRLVSKLGYVTGNVGVADSAFTAQMATICSPHNARWHVVPHGMDAKFLAPHSIRYLPISEETKETLIDLGIRSIGQFARLSKMSIMDRFGSEGEIAYALAGGLDYKESHSPKMPSREPNFQCFVEIGAPLSELQETLFVVKSMLERLTVELRDSGLCAEELTASFFHENELFDERPIKLIRPSNNSKFLLEVLRLSLEAHPLMKEFTALRLGISRHIKESWEQTKLASDGQLHLQDAHNTQITMNSTSLLLQRFAMRLGEDSLVKPVPNDQYFHDDMGGWVPVSGKQQQIFQPVNAEHIDKTLGPRGLVSSLVLRKYIAPAPVFVELDGTNPTAITYGGQWRRINKITTPECLSGLWWENPVRKSYYVALLEEKLAATFRSQMVAVLLVHDHEHHGWFVEGVFD